MVGRLGIGNGIGIPFRNKVSGEGAYLSPDLKEALVGVWIADQNTNESPTRNIIKNKIPNKGGDFKILNASYTEGSGYKDGAFVTDGVDDLIVSQKSVSDMLGGSNEITVVSMMEFLGSNWGIGNCIFPNISGEAVRTNMENNRIAILGYKGDKTSATTAIDNALGDNKKWGVLDKFNGDNSFFYPVSYAEIVPLKYAWYWTLIAKRVLTTDEINQVIAYYNLDKYVAPDIYYDVKKQGLTNENHAEFGDKLIDYSGNGHDMQLYNLGWKLDSGVGKYEEDFILWTASRGDLSVSHNKFTVINSTNPQGNNYIIYKSGSGAYAVPPFTVKVTGVKPNINLNYISVKDGKVFYNRIPNDGVYSFPASDASGAVGFKVNNMKDPNIIGLTIEQLPSFEGALVFDGVDDYGKVEGLPIYKDYTVIADRGLLGAISQSNIGGVLSKSEISLQGAFIMDEASNTWSFDVSNKVNIQTELKTIYQTKYVYNGQSITAGAASDSDSMWLATIRDRDNRFSKIAIKSLLTFPYSLNEFLIERQLKKRKLGSLYPETNNK